MRLFCFYCRGCDNLLKSPLLNGMLPVVKVARPSQGMSHPVELGVHLSRRARRLLGDTGAVAKTVPNLASSAAEAARSLWRSCGDHQMLVWVDNWYRKRFGTDPRSTDMSLNVSVLAVLHIPEIPMFPGYKSLLELARELPLTVQVMSKFAARIVEGVQLVVDGELEVSFIRVPLDVHRSGMRSLQWTPYMLTEETVSSQSDLLRIVLDLEVMQKHTKRALPVLVDMDIHYRLMKLIYGLSTSMFNMGSKLALFPILYGVCY